VQALTISLDGRVEKLACDAVALCAAPSPAIELARAAGARVSWESRSQLFVVEADAKGACTQTVWVAGELRGPMSAAAAAEQGLVAGEAIAASMKGATS
jgi:pyruvate/2-oxoglutarate dehydrogenase complex dihydrolipoamide dehydrogenase (E3) component